MNFNGVTWNIGGLRHLSLVPLTLLWLRTFSCIFIAETQEVSDTFVISDFARFSKPAVPSISGHAKGGIAFFLSNSDFGSSTVEVIDSPWDWVLPITIFLPASQTLILLIGVYIPR